MININIDLLVPLVLFRILPKIRERGVKQPRTNGIRVRDIAPFGLAGGEHLVEVRPLRDVGLHVEDFRLAGREGVEISCGF